MIVRLSISVPDELKAKMDKIESRVNWSSVAQTAFNKEITLQKPIEAGDMDQVVERLKASKEESIKNDFAEGIKYGAGWAALTASYEDLREIDKIDVDNLCSVDKDRNLGILVDTIFDPDPDRHDVEQFLSDHFSGERTSAAEIKGFIVGVQAIWNEVADKI